MRAVVILKLMYVFNHRTDSETDHRYRCKGLMLLIVSNH